MELARKRLKSGGNTVPLPGAMSGPIGVTCPTCLARPRMPCRTGNHEKRRPHRARIDKAAGRTSKKRGTS